MAIPRRLGTRQNLSTEEAQDLEPDVQHNMEQVPVMTPELCRAIHVYLATSRAWIVMANLDDLISEVTQMNLPGTLDTYPNWFRKLLVSLEDLRRDERGNCAPRPCVLFAVLLQPIGRGPCASWTRDEEPRSGRPCHCCALVPRHHLHR
ncbi:MAG: 4-alpha-glucanotransferase [Nitrospira sp.]|nr:4-alpha-glucanotransferase [Nitrospira sp.]